MASKERLTPILWAWQDLLLSLFACLLVATILIASKKPQEPKQETDRSAGNISVYTFWQDNIDADIDLHLRDPEGQHIFFSQKSGKIWSLLRDDLGRFNDITPRNFENAYGRGLAPGEYTVNVHAYRNNGAFPIEIDGELRIQRDPGGTRVTFNAHVTLDHVGDEATLWRFTIDNDGNLVPGSVHNQFTPLAGKGK